MKSIVLLLFLLELIVAEELVSLERAKELRKIAKWKVANPNKNPLKKYTFEEFVNSMKGNRPITRDAARTLKGVLKGMDRKAIKALVENNSPVSPTPAGKRRIPGKAAGTKDKFETKNTSRTLQDEDHWWEEDMELHEPAAKNTTNDTTNQTHNSTTLDQAHNETAVKNATDNSSFSVPSNTPDVDKKARREDYDYGYGVPRSFDGRDTWGGCIHSGGDQSTCNGCWAFGIANHISDRFCIMGRDVTLSVQDLLECTPGNSCCEGGTATRGYDYLMSVGLVSESCKEFTGDCGECSPSSCTHYRCESDSMFWADNTEEAKIEIYNNGPIEGVFDVYDDFIHYSGGVYYRTSNKYVGVHTVEILGWGVEDGVEYWLCKNSWADDWGDEGFFKIRMGECGINEALTTCRPEV